MDGHQEAVESGVLPNIVGVGKPAVLRVTVEIVSQRQDRDICWSNSRTMAGRSRFECFSVFKAGR